MSDQLRNDLTSNDLDPACPRCGDLSTSGAKRCESCGMWLLDRGPTASELSSLAAQAKPPPKTPDEENDNGRFVVRSVTGYRIFPDGRGGAEGADYLVCDSAICYHTVKSWPAGAASKLSNKERRARAYRAAARLNQAHSDMLVLAETPGDRLLSRPVNAADLITGEATQAAREREGC